MPKTLLPGLSSTQVAERSARGQVNRVKRSDFADYLEIVRRNLLTLFNLLVVPSAIALLWLGDYRAGIAVSGMMVINTALGLGQEIRAKRHLDHLASLTEARARVLRDGLQWDIPSGDVVLGDLVLLAPGDTAVADGPLLEARYLEVDEALLTGESDPVPRNVGDSLLSGSFAVAGDGVYRADRVGQDAFAQRTTAEARSYRHVPSPLQKALDRVILVLTLLAVLLSGFYLLLFLTGRTSEVELFRRIAATITSMVPQGLVLMATLAYLIGAVRMSAKGAVVQRLNAVESMAAVDVLCMDKTGTLTTNRLRLEKIHDCSDGGTEVAVKGHLRRFASTSIDRGSKSLAALRDALGEESVELLDQLPFKSQNRYSAVHVRAADGDRRLVLGAFEALRPFLTGSPVEAVEIAWRELVKSGLRILLFAEAHCAADAHRTTFDGSLVGFVLRPLAFVSLSDEVRPEANAVLEMLAGQGVHFKVISGDNAETVRATIHALGEKSALPALRDLASLPVVTGLELEQSANPAELIRTRTVFGRIAPAQKLAIIKTLQSQGRFVAMIGDGVNDVLSIKNAHLGIAMGDGSRAAKTVSGLVLENNDFGLLPETLEEGRTILRNLRRSSKLFLVKNVYTLILIVGALGFLGLPFPFLPQQVTLLNLLTIGIPALLMTLSKERSAPSSAQNFLWEVGSFVVRTGPIIAVAGLSILYLSHRVWQDDEQTQRTLLLSTLVLLGLTTLVRSLRDGERQTLEGDHRFRWLAAGAIPVYLLAMYWPPSAWYHALAPLSVGQWAWVLGVTAVGYFLVRWTDRRRSRGQAAHPTISRNSTT